MASANFFSPKHAFPRAFSRAASTAYEARPVFPGGKSRRRSRADSAGSSAGASGDCIELLAATGLLGDGDAVPRPRDAEDILADYLTDHLVRGAVRALDVDSMDEPGMISV